MTSVFLDRGTALLVVAIAGLGVVGSCGATSATTHGHGAVETRVYRGTREVRHTIDVVTNRSRDNDYYGTFDVEASRTSKRSGNTLVETETRVFAVRTGGYRFDAAMREIVVRDEHVGSDEDVLLDKSELDRATFGYLAPPTEPPHGILAHSPFDGVDREQSAETYETPPLVFLARAGTNSNVPARSTQTTILHDPSDLESGSISEHVSADGAVRGSKRDFVVEESFEQNADGSGHSNSSAVGFYNVDLQFAPAAPLAADGTYAIHVTSSSTGREAGPPPYPVATAAYTVPDWYPGGKALPADSDVVSASGTADTPVPQACGAASRGLLAHRVVDHRERTRITGTTEDDSDETYWARRMLLCVIERRHVEHYDVTSGKRTATDDETTTLGITRR